MILGSTIRGGRRILGEAAKKRKGVTADIARKEKKLTATENKLKDAEKTLRNKRQAAKNLEKRTNTKQRVKAGQEVVQIKNQIKTLEDEIKGLVSAIQGNVTRTHKAKKTPDWLRTDTAGEVPDTAGLTKRKPSGQQDDTGSQLRLISRDLSDYWAVTEVSESYGDGSDFGDMKMYYGDSKAVTIANCLQSESWHLMALTINYQ